MIVISGRTDLTSVTGARCTRCAHEVDHEGILLLPNELLATEGIDLDEFVQHIVSTQSGHPGRG